MILICFPRFHGFTTHTHGNYSGRNKGWLSDNSHSPPVEYFTALFFGYMNRLRLQFASAATSWLPAAHYRGKVCNYTLLQHPFTFYLFCLDRVAVPLPPLPSDDRRTQINYHSHSGTLLRSGQLRSCPITFTKNACLWTVGGHQRTRKEPTQA